MADMGGQSAGCPWPARPRSSPAPRPASAPPPRRCSPPAARACSPPGFSPTSCARPSPRSRRTAARRSRSRRTSPTRPRSRRSPRGRRRRSAAPTSSSTTTRSTRLGPWHEADAAEWDAVFATNVRSYFLLAKAVRPQMLARGGGAIVNVASVTFYWGEAGLVSYVASKGAVIGFTRSLPARPGPRASVSTPSPRRVPDRGDRDPRRPGRAVERRARGAVDQAPRRGGGVARAIAFFAGDDSGFVSGQTLLVDGGWMRG